MVRCSKCGFEDTKGSIFCKKCGIKLEYKLEKAVKCGECDFENKEGSKFCKRCGIRLEYIRKEITPPPLLVTPKIVPERPKPTISIEKKIPETVKCDRCGVENKEGSVFCKRCGTRLEYKIGIIKCAMCGTENKEGSVFCKRCGTKLEYIPRKIPPAKPIPPKIVPEKPKISIVAPPAPTPQYQPPPPPRQYVPPAPSAQHWIKPLIIVVMAVVIMVVIASAFLMIPKQGVEEGEEGGEGGAPSGGEGTVDSDGDGYPDSSDAFPTDPAASKDTDNDGYPDEWNPGKTQSDSTTGLTLDAFPNDLTEWKDSDDDGRGDNGDAFPNNPSEWKDTDDDGVGDNSDVFPYDASETKDNDNDGIGDNADTDDDNDGMPDIWENTYGLDPLDESDAGEDPDFDDLTNVEEYLSLTNPKNSDTDSDGMPDGWEVDYGLNPKIDDSLDDKDGDRLTNIGESECNSNPLVIDTDDDGLDDWVEYSIKSDPTKIDTDGDTMPDWYEHTHGLNPASAGDKYADADSDGLTNIYEYTIGTDPANSDTDSDGYDDGIDLFPLGDALVSVHITEAENLEGLLTDGDGGCDFYFKISIGGTSWWNSGCPEEDNDHPTLDIWYTANVPDDTETAIITIKAFEADDWSEGWDDYLDINSTCTWGWIGSSYVDTSRTLVISYTLGTVINSSSAGDKTDWDGDYDIKIWYGVTTTFADKVNTLLVASDTYEDTSTYNSQSRYIGENHFYTILLNITDDAGSPTFTKGVNEIIIPRDVFLSSKMGGILTGKVLLFSPLYDADFYFNKSGDFTTTFTDGLIAIENITESEALELLLLITTNPMGSSISSYTEISNEIFIIGLPDNIVKITPAYNIKISVTASIPTSWWEDIWTGVVDFSNFVWDGLIATYDFFATLTDELVNRSLELLGTVNDMIDNISLPKTFNVNFANTWTYDLSNTKIYQDTYKGVNIKVWIPNGMLNFTPSIDLSTTFSDNLDNLLDACIIANVAMGLEECDVRAEVSGSINYSPEDIDLYSFTPYFFTQTLPCAPYVIWEEVQITIYCGFELNASAGGWIQSGITGTADVFTGVGYNHSTGWTPISGYELNFAQRPISWGYNGQVTIRPYVGVRVNVWVYSALGPQFKVEPYLKFDGDLTGNSSTSTSYDWELYGGVEFKAGLDLRAFDEDEEDKWETTLYNYLQPIASSSGHIKVSGDINDAEVSCDIDGANRLEQSGFHKPVKVNIQVTEKRVLKYKYSYFSINYFFPQHFG